MGWEEGGGVSSTEVYRGFFRVWAKLRREFVQTWQKERGDDPDCGGHGLADASSRSSRTFCKRCEMVAHVQLWIQANALQ